MSLSLFSRFVLVLSGLTALFVSLSVLFDPLPFYRGYGIEAGASPGLLNELKAPAGSLLFAGILALLGAAWPRFTGTALGLSAFLFLSYGISRGFSVVVDGVPGTETLVAMGLEGALGLSCLWLRFFTNTTGPGTRRLQTQDPVQVRAPS